ncbi:MAG TPA: hypothetical protein VFM18_14810, partial [Methanosarcina sp.]|nr:hypothetical protein [Methanosarcina sp.]
NSSGEIDSPKVWIGSVTTNSSGAATVTYSSAGFSSITSVQLTALRNGADVTTAPLASIVGTPTTTSCNILTVESKNTGVLLGGNVEGLEISASVTVYVTVWGT